MLTATPPNEGQFEVTLIGPSVGECVVLHYQGCWFVVDSCLDRSTRLPAARVYLESIGVSPDQVKVVACTHWHDDHFKGISDFYKWAPQAQFWLSGALRTAEFVQAMEVWREWPEGAEPHSSGLAELTAAVDEARTRGHPPRFAHHDQRIWQAADGSGELWSLSPSAAMVVRSFAQIAQLLPSGWAQKNALADRGPNHWAVAMHFRAGHHSVLLGSDLEEEGDAETGWSAVLASGARPQAKAGLYKVAHHGSITGHHDGIWATLLADKPVSILSPFTRSRLPRPTDIERLKDRSSRSYLTAIKLQENKRKGAVSRLLATKNLRASDGPCGRLRARIDGSDPAASWHVELDGPAAQL